MIRTERLLLRNWQPADREVFAEMGRDEHVMRFFPALLDRRESDAAVDRMQAAITEHGWGKWALEILETGEFVGFAGLQPIDSGVPFAPAVEIGWRLARSVWGHGYATEAARAALRYAFTELDLAEVVSFTSVLNEPSWRVMQRIGMTRRPEDDFDYLRVPEGSRLCRHVLYRLTRDRWSTI
jgi:RimJ/RimL family protein N-acetyltransferase